MYFDAVLDENYMPVQNDIPENIAVFLRAHPELHGTHKVAVGRTLEILLIPDYLEREKKRAPANRQLPSTDLDLLV